MKASQFSDAQKAFILKQGAEGVPVTDICRKAGISPATYFNWKKFEGMTPPEMRRLKQLEDENTKLRKLVADLSLDREMLQDVIRRKRELVDAMRGEWDVSIRRVCRVIEMDTSTYHYRSRRPDQAGLKEICATRVRYGYRRIHVLLQRGWDVNHKRTYKLCRELGLQLRNKTPKRRVKAKLRDDRHPATRPNEVGAMDFLHDQLATGTKIRVLTVVDTFSRFSPVLDARLSYRGEDVVLTLDRVCSTIGYPATIRVDQGSEFVSRDLDIWAYARGVTLDFSQPGKPTDNAFAEAFNSRVRAECMNAHWFLTLADAREKLEVWRRYYNEDRPHGATGHKPPIALQNPGDAPSPSPAV